MSVSSTVIVCPVDGKVILTVEVQKYKEQNLVMVERIYENMTRRVSYMSIKESIALNNLLSNLKLPKER